ncbi:MAG: hypothetical protein Q8P67_09285 [archaeon]|nr:hypothetical protein [archaeon]
MALATSAVPLSKLNPIVRLLSSVRNTNAQLQSQVGAGDFIVLTQPRSRSELLSAEINQRLRVDCLGELFNPDLPNSFASWYSQTHNGTMRVPPEEALVAAKLFYAKGWVGVTGRRVARTPGVPFGFKMFHGFFGGLNLTGFLRQDLSWTHAHPLKVIHLVRHEFFAGSLSLFEASSLNHYFYSSSKSVDRFVFPVDKRLVDFVSTSSLLRCLEQQHYVRDLRAATAAKLATTLSIDADDLLESQLLETIESVRQFLGASPLPRKVASSMPSAKVAFKSHQGRSALPLNQRVESPSKLLRELKTLYSSIGKDASARDTFLLRMPAINHGAEFFTVDHYAPEDVDLCLPILIREIESLS